MRQLTRQFATELGVAVEDTEVRCFGVVGRERLPVGINTSGGTGQRLGAAAPAVAAAAAEADAGENTQALNHKRKCLERYQPWLTPPHPIQYISLLGLSILLPLVMSSLHLR